MHGLQSFMESPERKGFLGRPRRRWEVDIKLDLREVCCNAGYWIDLAQGRVQWQAYVRAIMNVEVP